MPLTHSNENLAQVSVEELCNICNSAIIDKNNMSLTLCNHKFHNECLSSWFQDHSHCPTCNSECQTGLASAFDANFNGSHHSQNFNATSGQGTSRGNVTIPRGRPNTRSRTAQLNTSNKYYHDSPRPQQQRRKSNTSNVPPQAFLHLDQSRVQTMIDNSLHSFQSRTLNSIKDTVVSLINESLQTYFSNMDINTARPNMSSVQEPTFQTDTSLVNNTEQSNVQVNPHNQAGSMSPQSSFLKPDKISNIILNWRFKFDGSVDTMPVDEFIYRAIT